MGTDQVVVEMAALMNPPREVSPPALPHQGRSPAPLRHRHHLEAVGPIGQQARQDVAEDLDLLVPLKAFFEEGLPHVLVIFPVIAKHWHNKDAGILSLSFSGISVSCLVVSFLIHSAALAFRSCRSIQQVPVRCNLAYLSVFLRIVAATFLLLFLDPVRHRVAILPLSFLALVLLTYFRIKTINIIRPPTPDADARRYWVEHKAELKLRFDLSSQVVTFAYAGLLGTVLGSVKKGSTSNQLLLSGSRGYMAPDCFLSYSILLGLLVQLLSTVPSYIYQMDTRRRMAKVYLRIVAYASLMFLVLAGVMAAEEILREWVFISCFIIVFIPVLCFCYESETEDGGHYFVSADGRREEDDKDAAYVRVFFTSSFAALMASNSIYGIETAVAVSLSVWFKFYVLSVLHGVLSYAVCRVFVSEMPQMKSSAFPKKVWTWSMLATVPMTILLVVVVILRHPDEIKYIF